MFFVNFKNRTTKGLRNEERSMPLEDFAERLGITRQTIISIEGVSDPIENIFIYEEGKKNEE